MVQRSFDHKGKKKEATTYGQKSPALPKIHGVSDTNLRLLADDAHDYGAIENKQQFEAAWALYEKSHTKQAEVLPLDQEQNGAVTVLELPTVEQSHFKGSVRMTLQLDWLQGKHDGPFMADNSNETPRKSGGNQMRRTLADYQKLARGAPLELAKARLAEIFKQGERAPLDFSVMASQQSDGLFYEISAKWAKVGERAAHVLVYYHCYPASDDQRKWGFSPKG